MDPNNSVIKRLWCIIMLLDFRARKVKEKVIRQVSSVHPLTLQKKKRVFQHFLTPDTCMYKIIKSSLS